MLNLPERSSAGRGALRSRCWKADGRMGRWGVVRREQWQGTLDSRKESGVGIEVCWD